MTSLEAAGVCSGQAGGGSAGFGCCAGRPRADGRGQKCAREDEGVVVLVVVVVVVVEKPA